VGTVGRVLRGLGIAWAIFATLQILASLLGYVDGQALLIAGLKLGLAYGAFRAGTWLKNGAARIAEDDARKAALQAVEADTHNGLAQQSGMCPNCKKVVLLEAQACKHCGASFGEGSSWKPTPLRLGAKQEH
jgi:hypothetical protein